MKEVKVFDETNELAASAAKLTVTVLRKAIRQYGNATWVFAGGTTPLAVYKVMANKYGAALDWSKVTVLIGDERIGPLKSPDNNWHKIEKIIGGFPFKKIRPDSNKHLEDVVSEYEQGLMNLPKADNGLPRFDMVWLGVGSDGHTLSLFPQHSSLLPNSGLVTAVYNSPKPPTERISLTLRAMQGAKNVLVLATGSDKKAAVKAAVNGDHSPIAIATSIVETHEGQTTWMIDRMAAPTD